MCLKIYKQFLFLIYFFIEGYLLYRTLLFSVKPQHESAIGIHTTPPFWTSLPSLSPSHPSRLIESLFEFPELYSKYLLAIYFTYGSVSFCVTLSIHLTISSPLPISIGLFSMSVSPLLPVNKFLSTIFLDGRRQWQPTPALLPGKSHGWRGLVCCNPWSR